MAAGVIQTLECVCDQLGLTRMSLVSYSGHAPQFLASFTPSGMIFIPSVGGVSHHPDEYTDWDDVINGTNVLLHAILQTAGGV
jgi:N-carbamoyl-L-amino-acid hydrolase